MGEWSNNPWDKDTAADWFGDLMDTTGLRDEWHKGIMTNPEGLSMRSASQQRGCSYI
ncbi:MAG: DUF4259 domain-containing protein [Propionibacteriaceae bacterium]|nr:DUF4259 domain-containing protein [Propionibacteriaceae bacterium]